MKTPHAYDLSLVDLNLKLIGADDLRALKVAALARPRRMRRDRAGKTLKRLGYNPNPDSWRDVAARYLRRYSRQLIVHVGGHHIAMHLPQPAECQRPGSNEYGPCLGRIVETKAA